MSLEVLMLLLVNCKKLLTFFKLYSFFLNLALLKTKFHMKVFQLLLLFFYFLINSGSVQIFWLLFQCFSLTVDAVLYAFSLGSLFRTFVIIRARTPLIRRIQVETISRRTIVLTLSQGHFGGHFARFILFTLTFLVSSFFHRVITGVF